MRALAPEVRLLRLKLFLAAALAANLSSLAAAQGPPPDPAHIPFTLPADIQWTGPHGGEYTATLFGDPNKPGPYGILAKWMPGNYSHPHFHSADRWIYVVSGTWWVSSSSHFDPAMAYPLPAGTFAIDRANTVHWDGAKAGGEPAVLELVGMGPVTSTGVDENGQPLPPKK
jgi:quercetin dioxygenase-like cupin family protein